MNITNIILDFLKKLFSSALEYKFSSFFIFLFSIASILLVNNHFNYESTEYIYLINIIYTSSIGFFLTLVAYFSNRKKVFLTIALLLTTLYYYYLPFENDYSIIILFTKYFYIITISMILLLYIPFQNQERDNQRFLNWAINILESIIISLIFGVILFISLYLAITSIVMLFDLNIKKYTYGEYLAIVVFGIFCTHYFLLSLNKNPKNLQSNLVFYNKIGNFFSKYILTTIVVVYSLILLGYIIKILILKEWPNGVVVWLSITFAIFSLITYIFWTPYKNKYKKILIFIALIQLSLLFTAISMRITQYGWSTNRYMIVMTGVWLIGSFLYILLYKKYRYEYIFLAFAILLIFSQYGYKINSYYVNDVAQLNKLKELLSQNSNLSNKTNKDIRCNISSSIDSLYQHRNIEFLNEAIPTIYDKYKSTENINFPYFATESLGFNYLSKWVCGENQDTYQNDNIHIYSNNSTNIIDISGYDIMDKNVLLISYQDNKYTIKIPTKDNMNFSEFDMTEFINKFKTNTSKEASNQYNNDELTFITEDKNMKIKIFFNSMSINELSGDIIYLNTYLLIKYLK
ncbi:DUF4153 domain-containing protein [Aliarcobacter lanthieri]|uniref:DUF4153 domain-containing protein n=1 Tax=Aliarcobacter lanthieri TaxID=1355374 RepID=UPI003AA8B3A0